jgi:hypothetical protein
VCVWSHIRHITPTAATPATLYKYLQQHERQDRLHIEPVSTKHRYLLCQPTDKHIATVPISRHHVLACSLPSSPSYTRSPPLVFLAYSRPQSGLRKCPPRRCDGALPCRRRYCMLQLERASLLSNSFSAEMGTKERLSRPNTGRRPSPMSARC